MVPRTVQQLSFADLAARRRGRRGRKRPGPKPGPRPAVRHRTRPVHKHWHPLHVTLRAVPGLPSFRAQMLYKALDRALRRTRREDFRIVEFSVQDNHVHLIVEADDNDALARGMKSFSVRANRLFNIASGRKRGRVWGDRYHRVDLTSPRQVRNALVYCLNNRKKHANVGRGTTTIDLCSSALWFDGWTTSRARDGTTRDAPTHDSTDRARGPSLSRPTELARTYLLRTGWHRHGFIHPGEFPRSLC